MSEAYIHYMEEVHKKLITNLIQVQEAIMKRQKAGVKSKRSKECQGMQHPEFKIGDEVMLSTKNMNREKLGERFAGPFKVSWVG